MPKTTATLSPVEQTRVDVEKRLTKLRPLAVEFETLEAALAAIQSFKSPDYGASPVQDWKAGRR